MKKLSKLVLHNDAKIMTAPQMKHITGGYGGGYSDGAGTCCYNDRNLGAICGVSKEIAESKYRYGSATNWCCDGCGDATWIGTGYEHLGY